MADALESIGLLAPLASAAISHTYELLRPLHDEGHIPQTHLRFVRQLIASGTCVCGQDLAVEGAHRRHVEQRIAESKATEDRANYLHKLYDASASLRTDIESSYWSTRLTANRAELATCESELLDLENEKKEIDTKLKEIEESKIQLLRDEEAALVKQVETLQRNEVQKDSQLKALREEIIALDRQIHARQRKDRAATDHRRAEPSSGSRSASSTTR